MVETHYDTGQRQQTEEDIWYGPYQSRQGSAITLPGGEALWWLPVDWHGLSEAAAGKGKAGAKAFGPLLSAGGDSGHGAAAVLPEQGSCGIWRG